MAKQKQRIIYNNYDHEQVKAYYRKKQEKKKKRKRRILALGLIVVLIVAFFISDFSKIQTITVTGNEKVSTEDGERLILTFEGDSPFTLIEETIKAEEEHTIIPTFGEPDWLGDTIGVVSTNSVNWYSNGIEYYVISNALESSEILEIARSISVIPVSK